MEILEESEISSLRSFAQYYMQDQDYESAIFLLEHICIYSSFQNQGDVYFYAQALITAQRYASAYAICDKYYSVSSVCHLNYHNNSSLNIPLWVKYLAAKCLTSLGKVHQAMDLLSTIVTSSQLTKNQSSRMKLHRNLFEITERCEKFDFVDSRLIMSSIMRLKAQLLEYSRDTMSTQYCSSAVVINPTNFTAARRLFENMLLTRSERKNLLQDLSIPDIYPSEFISPRLLKWFVDLWMRASGLIEITPESVKNYEFELSRINPSTDYLQLSSDVIRWDALKFSDAGNRNLALKTLSHVLNRTSYNDYYAVVLYSILLFKNGDLNGLDILSSELVSYQTIGDVPNSVSQFVEGVRKMAFGKPEDATVVLKKSAILSTSAALRHQPWVISPTIHWMALGHASWLMGDRENALASFVSAADSSPGAQWAWFQIALLHSEHFEYSTSHAFLKKALSIMDAENASQPAVILNEIGCVDYYRGRYESARTKFLSLIQWLGYRNTASIMSSNELICSFSSVALNLAHCLTKLGLYSEALEWVTLGLGTNEKSRSLHRLAGFLKDMLGQHIEAQQHYHLALMYCTENLEGKHSKLMFQSPDHHTFLPPIVHTRIFNGEKDQFAADMIKLSLNAMKSSTSMEMSMESETL